MLWFASTFFAQDVKISPEKKILIAEIISVIKADEKVKQMMQVISRQRSEGYPAIVKAMLAERTELTPAQKNKIAAALIRRNNGEISFQNRIVKAIDFQEYVEQTFYPLYDKFFTEAELKDLLEFYKSPTGRKSIEVLPELTRESFRLAQEVLLPKLVKITDQIINEDIEEQKKLSGK